MTQVAHLGEVIAQPQGSQLVVAASVSDSTLTIDYAGEFSAKGGTLDLNGAQLEYDSITEGTNPADPDVINLTVPLAVTAGVGDWVGVVAGGQALVDYVAICATDDGDEIRVPITDQQIPFYGVGIYDPSVPIYVSDDLLRLESAPGRTPSLRGDQVVGIPYKTAQSGERIEMQVSGADNPYGQVSFWTAIPSEDPSQPASITMQDSGSATYLSINASGLVSGGVPLGLADWRGLIRLISTPVFGSIQSTFEARASNVSLIGAQDIQISAIPSGTLQLESGDGMFLTSGDTLAVSTINGTSVSGPLVARKAFQSGVEPSPSGTTNVTRTLNVTFATPFDVTPVVTATILVASSTANVRWQLGAVSTTGFTVYALRVDAAGSYDLHWQATAPTQ